MKSIKEHGNALLNRRKDSQTPAFSFRVKECDIINTTPSRTATTTTTTTTPHPMNHTRKLSFKDVLPWRQPKIMPGVAMLAVWLRFPVVISGNKQ